METKYLDCNLTSSAFLESAKQQNHNIRIISLNKQKYTLILSYS